jgi:guanyl-specific ribonuclease Sa
MIGGAHWLRVAALIAFAAVAVSGWLGREGGQQSHDERTAVERSAAERGLPPEAEWTLQLIQRGGPFPYERDGTVFQNRERRLPDEPRGYYREYTVPTPGSPDRGARRIVVGGEPPAVYYYTDDHYRTFRRIEVAP